MRFPITLQPGSIIPRDPNLIFRVKRAPAPAVLAAATPVEASEEVTIGAGADNFADATVIPFEAFRDILAGRTYSKDFTTEVDEPDVVDGTTPHKTAWWKLTVPADKTIWLDVDLEWSFGNGPSADTQLAVYRLSEEPDFGNLTKEAESEDIDATFWFSRIGPLRCRGTLSGDPEGTVYYIQAGNFNAGTPNICYVLRVSVIFDKPGTIPDDGTDPDA